MMRRLVVMLSVLVVGVAGCEGAKGPAGPAGDPGAAAVTNATCLSSSCHGDTALKKTIVTSMDPVKVEEFVPLFVDQAAYAASVHGAQLCVSCHNDINASGGAHGPVAKTYGGWSRFSKQQAAEAIGTNEILRTRNYVTAASRSCATCHTSHSGFQNSAHATIYKMRAAHIDTELTAIATADAGAPTTIGEDYVVGNCNRCHATCSTCHFKSDVVRKNATSVTAHWDAIQATDRLTDGTTAVPDSMSEFYMDWTTNVASHDFRRASYFATDSEGVCEACHTGFQRPARRAYYWTDAAKTVPASVMATNVKRHPQATELAISGGTTISPLTGGANPHGAFVCADCHGTSEYKPGAFGTGDVHGLPGLSYEWSLYGDVQCGGCHGDYVHSEPTVGMHLDDTGTKVACIGCHTFGLARDFELAKTGTATSHEVFLDPVTNEVRPVVWKNGHAIAWYSHNWQTLVPGTGVTPKTDPAGSCAQKCHYSGNLVGAGF